MGSRQVSRLDQDLGKLLGPCGSGLARDSNFQFSISIGCEAAIAGKPAPTGFLYSQAISGVVA
ncbi:hypothetical protein ASD60_20390 [Pseudomonas sp. Root562]|nr:hypothetical protein ASD60_20390 [Pseudomonas sp. Root562]